ncbi:uncharacterized protein MONBRDRAFT_7048 [Monosiga brevicollis MX1]|uniref:Glycoside hydrolase family 42 N-terminal domain-containing protein n=1 Tax=Monosiga brevicollis TaxID=81824 RepID=A9UVR5_MONBE|nr:uncharacterized protein MONBRDRAFT_7048 [Monosiga brevicollis MX1]EDQ90438.1 predicted protein [Monosiga brevicollis MX1]|eukprot:XP_001744489.1 hypothetical protein [Monosiga brevicollis MX1]
MLAVKRQSKGWPCAWVCLGLLGLATLTSAQWRPPRLLLSFWVDPIVDPSQFVDEYARIQKANFTTILGGFGAKTESVIEQQISAAQANDLLVIPFGFDATQVSALSNSSSPALLGYQMKDEPTQADFADLRSWSLAVATARPGKLRFINLLPNYAAPSLLGTPTYGDYVSAFTATVRPDLLSMDHYPLFDVPFADPNSNATRQGYLDNLAVLRAAALAANISFVNFFNTMPFNNHKDPSLGEIRWQVFASLAYGSQGCLYFCYWDPGFPLGNAIMRPIGASAQFEPGPHYAHAAAINSHVLAYERFLLHARSTAVLFWNATDFANPVPSPFLIKALDAVNDASRGMFLLGQFDLTATQSGFACGLLLQNQRHDATALANITWTSNSISASTALNMLEVQYQGPGAGNAVAVLDDAPHAPGLQLSLAPGEGRFFVTATAC